MIDHVTLRVSDLEASRAFYDVALKPLGMKIVLGSAERGFYGWGYEEDPLFEVSEPDAENPPHKRVHIAFRTKDRATVDAFYHAALAAGATDNGAPGPRPQYTPTYYAAFVRDPDENNIEVCVH